MAAELGRRLGIDSRQDKLKYEGSEGTAVALK
jgi:hypothetical protein